MQPSISLVVSLQFGEYLGLWTPAILKNHRAAPHSAPKDLCLVMAVCRLCR